MKRVFVGDVPVVGGGAPWPLGEEGDVDDAARPRPIYLLADSQLLFPRPPEASVLEPVRAGIGAEHPRAAYLGAANGDEPAFYEIFAAAMENVGITDCRMVHARPSPGELSFLESADVVLLAGGDVRQGWNAFTACGVDDALRRRHAAGAALIGVSAGAVHLGEFGWTAGDSSPEALFSTLALAPWVVDAHAEDSDWAELRSAVTALGGAARGLGIPRGGGVVYHPDGTVEALRHPACEVELRGGVLSASLLMPPAAR